MEKMIIFFIAILLFLFVGCKQEDNSSIVDNKMFISNSTVKEILLNRGILTMKSLKGEYQVDSYCPLIYKDSFPSWIEDRHGPDFSIAKYKFKPVICDIDAPFVIFKSKNVDYFYIIKYKDTLKFKLKTDLILDE